MIILLISSMSWTTLGILVFDLWPSELKLIAACRLSPLDTV